MMARGVCLVNRHSRQWLPAPRARRPGPAQRCPIAPLTAPSICLIPGSFSGNLQVAGGEHVAESAAAAEGHEGLVNASPPLPCRRPASHRTPLGGGE